jgi:bifunctional DNA-binding transcriptional regulator/antitoxin component of YhaV-PrlF toxin-antitoxin module
MNVSIDAAGRVAIPKAIRDELGFAPDIPLKAEIVDGHLVLSASYEPARLIPSPYGPSFAATGTPITDADVRRTLEAVREHQ